MISTTVFIIKLTNPKNLFLKGAPPPKKSRALINFIIIIFAYSPIKKRAKGAPAYSTLYPETNSDSPSVKSKGARFVSARVEIYHIIDKGRSGKKRNIPL